MAAPRPKQFVAARDFYQVGGPAFKKGDPIPHGLLLERLLRFGDKFAVYQKQSKTATAEPQPPAEPPEGEAETRLPTKEA